MRYRKWFLLGMFLVGVLARAISSVHAQTITSFDAPGSTGTLPLSINPRGEITGYYNDSGGVQHGFVRDGRGTFTSFDVVSTATFQYSIGTFPGSITPAGEFTGTYIDGVGSSQPHAYLRC